MVVESPKLALVHSTDTGKWMTQKNH